MVILGTYVLLLSFQTFPSYVFHELKIQIRKASRDFLKGCRTGDKVLHNIGRTKITYLLPAFGMFIHYYLFLYILRITIYLFKTCCKGYYEKKEKTPEIVDCGVCISSESSLLQSALRQFIYENMIFQKNLLKLISFSAEKSRIHTCLIMRQEG